MIIKKALFGLLLILLIIPINKSCKQVEKVTDDAIEYSLNKLGDTFFSLITESPEKEEMRKKYDAFVQRSIKGEVDQEQIEYVAANMLNASNSQKRIKPELAASIVETTESADKDKDIADADQDLKNKPDLELSERKTIGEKLSKILDFNDKVRQSYANGDISEKVFYRFDEGIEINIDEELKILLEEAQQTSDIIKEFQKREDFTWVKDLSQNLKLEQAKIAEEIKNFEKLENLENLKELENFKFDFKYFLKDGKFKQFYFNDTSFVMPHIPQVNIDSILKSVEQSLKEVGVK